MFDAFGWRRRVHHDAIDLDLAAFGGPPGTKDGLQKLGPTRSEKAADPKNLALLKLERNIAQNFATTC